VCTIGAPAHRLIWQDRAMESRTDRLALVARLYAAYRQAPYPARLRGADIAGADMVLLDADVAGCVQTWLANDGTLEPRLWDALSRCLEQLDRAVPLLSRTEQAAYFSAARTLALAVWDTDD
jgi:hypothetical protein